MATPSLEERVRLHARIYAERGVICSVTVAVRGGRPVFADGRAAAATVDALRRHAEKTAVPVYGYCVMPNHVHLVLGPSRSRDIITFVGEFKNLAQRAVWQLGLVKGSYCQMGFYDHFLRAPEQLERVVDYVLDNPVRAGLVTQRGDYPYAGVLAAPQ